MRTAIVVFKAGIFLLLYISINHLPAQDRKSVQAIPPSDAVDTADISVLNPEGIRHIKSPLIRKEIRPLFEIWQDEPAPVKLIPFKTPAVRKDCTAQLEGYGYAIYIASEAFVPARHKLDSQHNTYLIAIDDQHIWGTDGEVPKYQISKLAVSYKGKAINIPAKAIRSLYQPNLGCISLDSNAMMCYNRAYLSRDHRRLYIYMMNGDGAGSYEVVWIFQDNKYYGRVVEAGC